MIYVIGDSHLTFISGHNTIDFYPADHTDHTEGFKTFRIGATAFHTNKLTEVVYEIIEKEKISEDDFIIFTCGEVDVRFYSTRFIRIIEKVEKVMSNSINEYYNFLSKIKERHTKIGIMLLFPQLINEITPDLGWGDRRIRTKLIKKYNDKLLNLCKTLDLFYIDMWKLLPHDENDVPDMDYFENDYIHLNNKILPSFIEEVDRVTKKYMEERHGYSG